MDHDQSNQHCIVSSLTFPREDEQLLYAIEECFASDWGGGGSGSMRIEAALAPSTDLSSAERNRRSSSMPSLGASSAAAMSALASPTSASSMLSATFVLQRSMHDSFAFRQSELFDCLNGHDLFSKYRIAGEGTYTNCDWMLTANSGKLTLEKDAFNWVNRTHRQVVERAFGMLVGRWLVLERELRILVSRVWPVVRHA